MSVLFEVIIAFRNNIRKKIFVSTVIMVTFQNQPISIYLSTNNKEIDPIEIVVYNHKPQNMLKTANLKQGSCETDK